jgi:hypothetical protein
MVVVRQHHRGHRDLRLLTAAAGLCVACGGGDARPTEGAAASASEAITNGTPTTGDLGVAALVEGGTLVCTATLVSPRVLLTAGHCLADGAMPDAFFGSAPQGGTGTTIQIIATRVDPAFDASSLTNDIAMALLADDAPAGATPWPLPPGPLGASSVGMPLRIVGFGQTGPGDTSPPQKRTGAASLGMLSATQFALMPSPSQTCEGDSGGPAFATIGGVEVVVGVTSSGGAQCNQGATDTRVDAYASFVTPWLAATAAGAAGPGDRCWYAANCAASAGACTAALDDASLSFCAPPCGAGASCPAGLACIAGGDGAKLCRHTPPSPGAAGSACTTSSDCDDASCVAPASGGGPVCAPTCFPDLQGFCSSGTQCRPVAGDAGASACFAPASNRDAAVGGGGCSAAGARSRSDPRDEPAGPAACCAALALLAARWSARLRNRRACAGARCRTDRDAP